MARTIKRKINANGTYEQIGYLPTQTPVEGTLNSVSVAGTTKSICKITPEALFVPSGLVMGGTAQQAGLVTRGICGVSVPDSKGACAKDNLYVNYDGNNNYSRKIVLGAGSVGTAIGNSNGAYTYCAVRGDQMTAYVANYVSQCGFITSGEANGLFATISDLNALSTSVDTISNKVSEIEKNLKTTSENTANNARNIQYARDEITSIKDTIADIDSFEYKVVSLPLPEPSESTMHIIYLIEHSHSDSQDAFDEYITLKTGDNSYKWEKIGNTDVDLSDYYTQEQIDSTIGNISTAISDLSEGQANNATAISKNTSAIADRYTKGEVDGKLGDKLSTVTMKPKYIFQCNGKHRFCKIATITTTASWANRPIIFECIGRGMNSQQVISVISDSQAVAGNTLYGCYKTTNDLVWALKNEGNGVCSLYCMCSEIWGNVQVVRVTWYAETNNVKMKMEGCDGFPDGCIFAKNVITASLADHASVADTANDIKYIPGVRFSVNKFVESLTKNLFGEDTSNSGHARITIVRADYETGVPDGIGILGGCGTGLAWYSTVDTGGFLSTNLGDNSLGKSATIGNIRGNSLDWWRYIVLSNNGSDIADQTVKSFTSTSINHGCSFNGDLSSTSVVTAPMHIATSNFSASDSNSPSADRNLTGNIEVTFGTTKKTIPNMKYNPFMKYFFEHGYHFSAVKEGGDDTLYDKGIVTYGQFIYYCVYTYHSDGSDAFDSAIIMTDDTREMSKYVMYEGGKAKGLTIEGNYIYTDGLKKVNIQEKTGTLALKSDIPSVPSVVDNLTSTSSYSTLSAYQGKVLNDKINGIKFSQLATGSSIGGIGLSNSRGDEDLTYSAHLSGGSKGGRFYVISGLENGYNSDYGKLVVKTSSNGKADMTTNAVAGVSGETGYWNPQWLSVSVFVPAGKDYYLWGCRINKVYYSCVELNK